MKSPWWYLTLLLIPIILVITIIVEEAHSETYMPTSSGIIALVVFFNFPSLVLSLHARPIYYDDLIIKNYNEDEVNRIYDSEFRKRYQWWFRWIVSFTSAVMCALMVDVWYFRTDLVPQEMKSETSTTIMHVEITIALGIIGGLLRIYYTVSMGIGKILMKVFKILKQRNINKLKIAKQARTVVELGNAGIRIASDDQEDDMSRSLIHSVSGGDLTVLGIKPNPAVSMNDLFE